MGNVYKPIPCGGLIRPQPYNVYKNWVVTNSNYRDDYYQISLLKGITPLYNQKINVSESINGVIAAEADEVTNSGSNNTSLLSNMFQKNVWSSTNQTFYKHRAGNERILFTSASIFSIPQRRMGDGVKPGSISITDKNTGNASYYSDTKLNEYHGHIKDLGIDTTLYPLYDNLIGYWGFNNELHNRSVYDVPMVKDGSNYSHHAVGKCLTFKDGINTTGTVAPSGRQITLNGSSSYVRVDHNSEFNFFKNDSYAISMWVTLPELQPDLSDTYNWLVSKNGTYRDYIVDNSSYQVQQRRNIATSIYPFDLKVYNQNDETNYGKLVASISDGLNTTEITSSTTINDSSQHHIVFNKTSTNLELWIDGTMEISSSLSFNGQVWNEYDILFGSRYLSDAGNDIVSSGFNALSGSMDEIRMYNTSLSSTEIGLLASNDYTSGSAYQTDVVGEVFYKSGIICISDPRPKYKNMFMGQTGNWDYPSGLTDYGFDVTYKSTKQLQEVSVICEIGASEFNVSQNPSLRVNEDIDNELLKGFITGSDFRTYVTTIGLYNDFGDLIAIGKLGSALKNRYDTDVSVKVRFDLDGPFGTPSTLGLPLDDANPTLTQNLDGGFTWNTPTIPTDWAVTSDNVIEVIPKSTVPKGKCPNVTPPGRYSLNFDGVDERLISGTETALNLEWSTPFTVEMWYRQDTEPTSFTTMFNTRGPNGILMRRQKTNGLLYFELWGGSGTNTRIYANTNLALNEWHHLVFTSDGTGQQSGMEIYIDTDLQSKVTLGSNNINTDTMQNASTSLKLMNYITQYADGKLRSTRMWSRVLSTDEINDLYNNNKYNPTTPTTNLILDLDMEDSVWDGSKFSIADTSGQTSGVTSENMEFEDFIFNNP
jgi:hypothetical protein